MLYKKTEGKYEGVFAIKKKENLNVEKLKKR